MKQEIRYDLNLKQYTLSQEDTIKPVPLKYKSQDSTRRFRTQTLRDEIINK
ncbi:MAG: hypothetical protein ACLFPL_03630 [Candidatus Nanoarchaeia archaeon]